MRALIAGEAGEAAVRAGEALLLLAVPEGSNTALNRGVRSGWRGGAVWLALALLLVVAGNALAESVLPLGVRLHVALIAEAVAD